MSFVYNQETRQHTLNGNHIPSVSQVIAPLTDFSGIPPDVLARKCELGIEFHEAIRLYLLNDLSFASLDPDIVAPMKTFIKWAKSQNLDGICEAPIHHKTLKFCGKPDLITETAIFDWKLRPYKPLTDILQLEAYKHMLPPGKRDRWTVCFDLEGNMKMHKAQHPKAWGIFRCMLERHYSEMEFDKLLSAWRGVN